MRASSIKYFFCVLTLVCGKYFVVGCVERYELPNHNITIVNIPADLTITNLSTGEYCNKRKKIEIEDSPYDILCRHGDIIQLKYVPPEDYKHDNFKVRYWILDIDTTIIYSPYIYEMVIDEKVPKGSYPIVCSVMCDKWTENLSSSYQRAIFRVE